ncbi:ATP-binding cassette sub-family C member 11 [Smittium culicis]|uniref:ATP-binding cassette sub-family C member 11 n=1 Tax=Smittium culicis TaxID=133412 RepID=A0A1R1Y1V4_9FUNG|nr:ATP-binding cassette sub-family C member 11 [Smittium culicis]
MSNASSNSNNNKKKAHEIGNKKESFIKKRNTNTGSPNSLDVLINSDTHVNDESKKERTTQVILKNINISVKKGELLGVVGPVGSGKSSLCNAILGEMYKISGEFGVQLTRKNESETSENSSTEGSIKDNQSLVAYSSQSPWIFGGSIRDNILFGNVYDEEWFKAVVAACSLERDLLLFEKGEFTLIGERGVTLSGGQRARISLARAVYSKAELYILDDPLSAVDPKVGKHIFDSVICGHLRNKTVILVTHQLQYVHKCDNIAVLENGSIVEYGPPNSISKLGEYKNSQVQNKTPKLDKEYNKSDILKNISKLELKKAESSSESSEIEEVKSEIIIYNEKNDGIIPSEKISTEALGNENISRIKNTSVKIENTENNKPNNNENYKIGNTENLAHHTII